MDSSASTLLVTNGSFFVAGLTFETFSLPPAAAFFVLLELLLSALDVSLSSLRLLNDEADGVAAAAGADEASLLAFLAALDDFTDEDFVGPASSLEPRFAAALAGIVCCLLNIGLL
jgi:hypothetical protein